MHSKSLASKREADALNADITARKLRADVLPTASRWTLDRAWSEWWSVKGETLAPSTQLSYRTSWEAHISPVLGPQSLTALVADPKMIEDHFAELRRAGVGPAARRKAMMVLSGVLSACARWRKIPTNPIRELEKPPAKPQRIPRPFAPIAIERIRQRMRTRAAKIAAATRPKGDACLVSVMSYAGLRPQECLALTFGDIGNRIAVDKAVSFGEGGVPLLAATKTRRNRTVPLLPPLAADLAEWRRIRGNPSDSALVFPAPGGGLWSRHAMNNWRRRVWHPALAALAQEADDAEGYVVKARPYDCRGSFVSLHLRAGASPLDVSQWAGHSPQVMYSHYAAVIEELEGEPSLPAEEQIERARQEVGRASEAEARALVSESLKPPDKMNRSAHALLYGPRGG
jgi:integrase